MTELRSASALAEVDALRAHFAAALHLLRSHELAPLGVAQRITRALLLDEIERYAAHGVFPENRHFPGERRPTFIDEDGTQCAVARLMHLTGAEALALEVQERTNFAAVPEIALDERVRQWAEAAGFTIEELAVLQPAYCHIPRTSCVCRHAGPLAANEALVVLEPTSTAGTYRITSVLESRLDVAVGSVIELDDEPTFRSSAMVRIGYTEDVGTFDLRSFVMSPNPSTEPLCDSWVSSALLMSTDDAKSALLSADPRSCDAYLKSLDRRWAETGGDIDRQAARCSEPRAAAAYTRACTTTLAPVESDPALLLAAVLAALALRRRPRRAG